MNESSYVSYSNHWMLETSMYSTMCIFVSSDHEEDVSHLGSGTLTGIKLDDVYFYVFRHRPDPERAAGADIFLRCGVI